MLFHSVSNTGSVYSWKTISEKQVCSEKNVLWSLPSSFILYAVLYALNFIVSIENQAQIVTEITCSRSSGTEQVNPKVLGFGAGSAAPTQEISPQ